MGIDNNFLRLLGEASRSGVNLEKTATIGRQSLWTITEGALVDGLSRAGWRISAADAAEIMHSDGMMAEGLLRFLGAREIDSFDYSDYEGATHVADMNRPIDPTFHRRYTTVLDGGSLEHIFNFPQAITNCMRMAAEGGHVVVCCPANNYFGHGFYQFSAELFFCVFSPENGFETERVVLIEDDQSCSGCFEVTDPALARQRVGFQSAISCQLYVQARKVKEVDLFATAPYQSDYVTAWAGRENASPDSTARPSLVTRLRNALKDCLPRGGREWLRHKLFPGPRSRPDLFRPLP